MQKKLYPHKPKKSNNSCPSCGFHISYGHTFEQVLSGKFQNDQNGGYTAYRSTPQRTSTMESDVLVPLAQSAVWSILAALPTIPIAFWLRYEWYFPVVIASASLLASWVSAMRKSESSLSLVEEFSYTPNDTDALPVCSSRARKNIQLEIKDKSENYGASLKIVDLPESISDVVFHEFCGDILAGKSLARKDWVGDGKTFSRDQYDELIVAMAGSGLICSVPGKGKKLTAGGKGAIRAMIRERKIYG